MVEMSAKSMVVISSPITFIGFLTAFDDHFCSEWLLDYILYWLDQWYKRPTFLKILVLKFLIQISKNIKQIS